MKCLRYLFEKSYPRMFPLSKKKRWKKEKEKEKGKKKKTHIYPDFSGLLPSNINGKIFKQ